MVHQVGEFELRKARSALEALRHAEACGSPSEIAGARRVAQMAYEALTVAKAEVALVGEIEKALLRPIRLSAR